jgi:hypothetical protein
MCTISHESSSINTIVINRNSNTAGTVNLTDKEKESSTNNYYLVPNTKKINNICLFYILKYYEVKLIENSKLTETINLPRNKLESLDIPLLNTEATLLIEKCIKLDEKIKKLSKMNESLESNDILYLL